jgi:uncharacterized protein YjbJ (UPF0337 family)
MMSDSIRDKAEGAFDKAKGEGKERLGQATDDKQIQGEGMLDQAKGEGEGRMADVKDKAGDLTKKVSGGS